MGKGDGGGGGANFCEVNIFILCAIIVCWTMNVCIKRPYFLLNI